MEKPTDTTQQKNCAICSKPILRGEGIQPMKEGIAHDSCYYEALGEEVERHPLGGHLKK
ncbi:MAG: hypothetical protein AAB365_03830 [Patescibacteria group bacterium]